MDQFTRGRRLLNTLESYTGSELSPSARFVALLLWFNGNQGDGNYTFTGRNRIAFALGLSERATTNALNQLKRIKLSEEQEPPARGLNWRRRIVDEALRETSIWLPPAKRLVVVGDDGLERPLTDDELRLSTRDDGTSAAVPRQADGGRGGGPSDQVKPTSRVQVKSASPLGGKLTSRRTASGEPHPEPLRPQHVAPGRGDGEGGGSALWEALTEGVR